MRQMRRARTRSSVYLREFARTIAGERSGRSAAVQKTKGALSAPLVGELFDFGFPILDMFLRDRIVFLLDQLVGHGARIFPGHVIVAGVGARHELDLQADGFGHCGTLYLSEFARKLPASGQMSRNAG